MLLKEARATLALALPIIGTQLAQMAIHTTDVFLLARLSERALAASALAVSIYGLFMMMCLGLAMGTSALAAQALGRDRGDAASVRHATHDGLIVCSAASAVSVLALWFCGPVLLWTGQEPSLVEDTVWFVRLLSLGFPAVILFSVLRGFTAALERPRPAMVLMVAAVVFNAVVNTVLVFGAFGVPSLGLTGAAIGSTVGNIATLLALMVYLRIDPQFAAYRLARGWWRSTPARLARYLRISAPIALTFASEIGLFSAAALLMGRLGENEVAAHQVALQWAAITFMVPMGIAQAATVRVGLAAGAGDHAGARRAGWIAIAMGVGFMACAGLTFWQAGGPLIAVFVPSPASPVYALAVAYLAWAALFQVVDGAQAVANGSLRGLHDTAVPMALAAGGYWLAAFPAALWFGLSTPWRGEGVWAGLALGLALVAGLLLWRFAVRADRRASTSR
ncbi:MAG: MATE family efflux transporter [Rhodospirillales bacterium]|nr:MAG: MATE family efflux transporter [Rhodospirillales bacterium]